VPVVAIVRNSGLIKEEQTGNDTEESGSGLIYLSLNLPGETEKRHGNTHNSCFVAEI
jgi:hypothetical protein